MLEESVDCTTYGLIRFSTQFARRSLEGRYEGNGMHSHGSALEGSDGSCSSVTCYSMISVHMRLGPKQMFCFT